MSRYCWLLALVHAYVWTALLGNGVGAEAIGRQLKAVPFRVLCLGDSTTEGWVPSLKGKYPYTAALQSLLAKKLPGRSVQVVEAGLGWGAALGTGTTAFVPFANSKLATNEQFDWVVVWIGANDLYTLKQPASRIFATLPSIYQKILSKGSNVIALSTFTPLDGGITSSDKREVQRQTLLGLIRNYASSAPRRRGQWFLVVDLATKGLNNGQMVEGFHLTKTGYERVGQIVYRAMTTGQV